MKNMIIIDFECDDIGIKGEVSFDPEEYDEMEMVEIMEMIGRVVTSWHEKRNFIHNNIKEYDVVFN